MHFFTVVLVQKDTKDIYAAVEELLAPYDEDVEVEEYDRKCECISERKGPVPDCELCYGKGSYGSTLNPDWKWDYWGIGGRWDGQIQGKQLDPDRYNLYVYEKGKLRNVVVQESEIEDNMCPASEIPRTVLPHAIVTPDGEWHGFLSDEWTEPYSKWVELRPPRFWRREIRRIFAEYPDHLAVGCDVHTL